MADLPRLNNVIRALEAGQHDVHFRFDPWRFRVGAWISAGALVALLALAARATR